MPPNKNVTFIDDLFDADSVNTGDDFISKGNQERDSFSNQIHNRHIRSHDKNISIAMNGGSSIVPQQHFQHQQHHHQHHPVREDFIPFDDNYQYAQFFQNDPQPQQQFSYKRKQPSFYDEDELSCMRIATHIHDCPICSKFYNSDNSLYIVCIVLLIIVCIILLKRIIEK